MGVDPCGALLVDKPAGPTSHDVVAVVRRALKTPRVGHTGTLDPLATGLLVLLVGPATRLAQFVAADEKEYIADVRLGVATPTYDAASRDEVRGLWSVVRGPSDTEIAEVLNGFRGTFLQAPPPYSAKKIASVPAYEKARRNQAIELKPVEVTVRELELLTYVRPSTANLEPPTPDHGLRITEYGLVRVRVAASAGFYVRSLAHDLGQRLGCGAHLEALRRVRAGRLSVADAIPLDVIVNNAPEARRRIIPPGELLSGLPSAALNDRGVVRTLHGNPLRLHHLSEPPTGAIPDAFVRVFDGSELVAVARMAPDGSLHPVVVLAGAPEVKY